MAKVFIRDITEIYPDNSGGRDRSFLNLLGDEWVYYTEDDYRRWQKGPYKLCATAEYQVDREDVESCKEYLRKSMEEIAGELGVDLTEVERRTSLENVTVKLLIELIATKIRDKKVDKEKGVVEPAVYEKQDGTQIYLLPSNGTLRLYRASYNRPFSLAKLPQ